MSGAAARPSWPSHGDARVGVMRPPAAFARLTRPSSCVSLFGIVALPPVQAAQRTSAPTSGDAARSARARAPLPKSSRVSGKGSAVPPLRDEDVDRRTQGWVGRKPARTHPRRRIAGRPGGAPRRRACRFTSLASGSISLDDPHGFLDGVADAADLLDGRGSAAWRPSPAFPASRKDLRLLRSQPSAHDEAAAVMLGWRMVAGERAAQQVHRLAGHLHAAADLVHEGHDAVDIGILGQAALRRSSRRSCGRRSRRSCPPRGRR